MKRQKELLLTNTLCLSRTYNIHCYLLYARVEVNNLLFLKKTESTLKQNTYLMYEINIVVLQQTYGITFPFVAQSSASREIEILQ